MYQEGIILIFFIFISHSNGQGCPHSATPVPGDPTRYIEIVHGNVHERNCAPGTEYNTFTCDCSVFSGASIQGAPQSTRTDSRRTSKRRKSKTAEFQYNPKKKESQESILFGLLADSALLNLLPTNPPSKAVKHVEKPQFKSEFIDYSLLAPTKAPKIKTFSALNLPKVTPKPKLKSPLLSQDLATIRAFLKERREQRAREKALLKTKQSPITSSASTSSIGLSGTKNAFSFDSGLKILGSSTTKQSTASNLGLNDLRTSAAKSTSSLDIGFNDYHKAALASNTGGLNTNNVKSSVGIAVPTPDAGLNEFRSSLSLLDRNYPTPTPHSRDTFANVKTVVNPTDNFAALMERRKLEQALITKSEPSSSISGISNTASKSSNGLGGLDATKKAILKNLVARLNALEEKNKGTATSSQQQNSMMSQTSSNSDQMQGQSTSLSQRQSLNNSPMFNSRQTSLQLSSARSSFPQSRSSFSQSSLPMMQSRQTPFSMMFRGVAAKEGSSDAQEIMQDRITEMGGAAALAMGAPLSMINSEISSQLSSTMLENGPLPFLM